MNLQPGTTYEVTHKYWPKCAVFATCLGEQTHISIYNTHDEYYRNTRDLERVFDKNIFELVEIQV